MNHIASVKEPVAELRDDLLIGADAIARYMGWYKNGSPNTRRIYHLAEATDFPVHKKEGLGLVARKSSINRYFEELDDDAD